MATEIRVPTLGESVTEATVGKWFKKVGDTIAADEPIVASVTDSPRVGTRISVAIVRSVLSLCGYSPRASSRNASSCAMCFDIRPVAGEAAAGRPV